MHTLLKFLYSLSISLWVGGIFFLAFFAAPSIFKILPRERAGDVVSDIFPKYYALSYICGIIALTSFIIIWYKQGFSSSPVNILQIAILVVMLGLAVYAGEVNRPKTHEARTELRRSHETSQNYAEISAKFRKLHKISAATNSIVLLLGIAILYIHAYNIRE